MAYEYPILQTRVSLVSEHHRSIEGLFRWRKVDSTHTLWLLYNDKEIMERASDYFDALCAIRRKLEEEGLRPVCYGASLHYYPSSMARDMSQGWVVFKMTIGQGCSMIDGVPLLAVGPDVVPATVEEQEQFFQEWLATPRVPMRPLSEEELLQLAQTNQEKYGSLSERIDL